MQPSEIRAVIRQYFDLVEGPDHTVVEDEILLPVLDHLAFAQHFVRFTFDPTEYPDPPLRKPKVCSRGAFLLRSVGHRKAR